MDTLLGIPIGVSSLDSAAEKAIMAIDSRDEQVVFACANSNALNVTRRDSIFRAALINAEQLVADGVGVSLVARLSGKSVGPRIIGQQYYDAVMQCLRNRGSGRVFYFGSSPMVLKEISKRFSVAYPELELCGSISPPFGDWSKQQNNEFLDQINSADPDVLWVGMTAPKQEKWVYKHRAAISAPVIGSVGAVFDFFAGTVSASPPWVRKSGLEAIYRLAMEPRRLWKRVLVSNVSFLGVGIWHDVLGLGERKPSK